MTGYTFDNHLPEDFAADALRADALTGLTADPKWLPPKWFYDDRGSELFEQITTLPEYYPTRAEREILTDRAAEIARASGADTLLELGSGSSEKTRLLLDALAAAGTLRRFVPVDVSDGALRPAADAIANDYPGVEVHAVAADFEHHLPLLPSGGRRLIAFLGGTIGNLMPEPRAHFLATLAATMAPGDTLLVGTDLVKSPDVLIPAYDDSAGVTAAFNKNVLHVLNRELKADFDPDEFDHLAVWNADDEWIEMRLRSRSEQVVRVEALGLDVLFRSGEQLRTEISAKFRADRITDELRSAGLSAEHFWTDRAGRYALTLARR